MHLQGELITITLTLRNKEDSRTRKPSRFRENDREPESGPALRAGTSGRLRLRQGSFQGGHTERGD